MSEAADSSVIWGPPCWCGSEPVAHRHGSSVDGHLIGTVSVETCAIGPAPCQHQFIPWLRLPNGSDWTECIECGKSYQYDH